MTGAAAIRIVRVGPEKAGAVARVLRTSFQASYPDVGITQMKRAQVDAAMAGDRVGGAIAHSDAEIDQPYTSPDGQWQGIATRLARRTLDHDDRLAHAAIPVNTRARGFCARHGFAEDAFADGDNETGHPDVRMEWCRT